MEVSPESRRYKSKGLLHHSCLISPMCAPPMSHSKESARDTETKIVEREKRIIKRYITLGYRKNVARHIPLYILTIYHPRDEDGKKGADIWFRIHDFGCRSITALEGLEVKDTKPDKEDI